MSLYLNVKGFLKRVIVLMDYLVCSHYSRLKLEQNENGKSKVINIDSIIFNIKRCFKIIVECSSYEQGEIRPK